MTEHNHRRGTRSSGGSSSWLRLPVRYTRFAQRHAHSKRRALVHKLITVERFDDIPGNTPKHVRWDYW